MGKRAGEEERKDGGEEKETEKKRVRETGQGFRWQSFPRKEAGGWCCRVRDGPPPRAAAASSMTPATAPVLPMSAADAQTVRRPMEVDAGIADILARLLTPTPEVCMGWSRGPGCGIAAVAMSERCLAAKERAPSCLEQGGSRGSDGHPNSR